MWIFVYQVLSIGFLRLCCSTLTPKAHAFVLLRDLGAILDIGSFKLYGLRIFQGLDGAEPKMEAYLNYRYYPHNKLYDNIMRPGKEYMQTRTA